MTEERRRHERFVIDAPVKVTTEQGEVDGRLHDISASGAAVEFAPDAVAPGLDIGDRVTLTPADGGARIGQVVRWFEGGVGVTFDDDDAT